MTKGEALQKFFSSFGMTAYPSTAIPADAVFPFLTYEVAFGGFGDTQTLNGNLWYYTESEAAPNAKVQEMSTRIGLGGVMLSCDGGAIWLKRGTPFAQAIKDEADPNIKRRYFNVTAEFLTMD